MVIVFRFKGFNIFRWDTICLYFISWYSSTTYFAAMSLGSDGISTMHILYLCSSLRSYHRCMVVVLDQCFNFLLFLTVDPWTHVRNWEGEIGGKLSNEWAYGILVSAMGQIWKYKIQASRCFLDYNSFSEFLIFSIILDKLMLKGCLLINLWFH